MLDVRPPGMYCQLCEIMANLFTCCRCRCRRRSQSDQPETPKDCKRDYKHISAEICMMHWIEQPSSQDKCNLGGGGGVGGWGWVWLWPKRYLDGQLNENMLKTTFKTPATTTKCRTGNNKCRSTLAFDAMKLMMAISMIQLKSETCF